MQVLVPIPITDAMLSSSTIAEPAAGETAWVSAGTYALKDKRIRSTTRRVYECVQAHTGRTALPEVDSAYWLDTGPTQKWAPFDSLISTQASDATSITYVLRPGFFNALTCYGLDGATLAISIKDAPGGAVIHTQTIDLTTPPLDWYDWAFGHIQPLDKALVQGITPYPDAELTLTLSAATGVTVKAGIIAVGDLRSIAGDGEWGGTQYGATAEPITYSYIKRNDDGTTQIVRRHAATDLSVNVVLPREYADAAVATVQSVLDVPAAWIATDASGYAALNVFGLGSGSMQYDSFQLATFSIKVKGLV
ncbi:MAG: hypothetical protein PHV02_08615 [Rhodocyclaceae bacterium]|nr:hypothetical protein [Rhodocyclaceae bacterium]